MASPSDQIRLVLASASPRRRELLSHLGVAFEVVSADVDERPRKGEPPRAYVERLAAEKAAAVARARPLALVLAADTAVVQGQVILGKPQDEAEAKAMLRRLAGGPHTVLTGLALAGRFVASRVVETTVHFRPLREQEIAWYVATGEGADKAGSYAVQGIGGVLVRAVEGSPSNVVGLPLAETAELLERAGLALPWGRS
ncbi:MAG: Maf family protein [Myxococcaceae bacterium]